TRRTNSGDKAGRRTTKIAYRRHRTKNLSIIIQMSDTLTLIQQAGKDGKLLPSSVENIKTWLNGGFLPQWATQTIDTLVADQQWGELNDRFYQQMKFGTGGMRGRSIGAVSPAPEQGELSADATPAHASVGSNVLNDFNIARATIGLYR